MKLEKYGVDNFIVSNSKYLKYPKTSVCTNTIEGTWSGIKQNLPNHMKTEENINSKLFEIIWRKKIKIMNGMYF